MGFIEELEWRGMLFDKSPGAEEKLASGMQTGYIGFDPTAPSLTIGNYVQLRILKLFQQHGHRPIVLMGGATGRIGDPSGKDKERSLLSYEDLDHNLKHQAAQASKYLNFDSGKNAALLINNYDFYKGLGALEFLRDVGKNITVNYMMAKDSVKTRLETGISYTEFSYQLLQAYDYVCLHKGYDCCFQMGGSDQWGNITSGTELVRKMNEGKAYAVTTPLLTKADGSKFGKSTEGNIWLDPSLTSPYKFYQYWINAADADIPKFIKYFSDRSRSEMEEMIAELENDPAGIKKQFAEEITTQVHSADETKSAMDATSLLFSRKSSEEQLRELSVDSFKIIKLEIQHYEMSSDQMIGKNIVDILAEATDITSSGSEARRALKGNAISINKVKTLDPDRLIESTDLIHNKYIMIENGKKNKYLLVIKD